ncbi:MAG: sulfatase family protein [Verrucomicrobiales bacterium]
MKNFLSFLTSIAGGMTLWLFMVAPIGGQERPNVILLMSDDQGWGDVGFNGNDRILTPHLDTMAAAGLRFERFYAASPLCSPTRGSCLTGRFPFRFGVLAAHTEGMRVGEITLAEMLADQGYATGFFGKWHLGWVRMEDRGSRGVFSPPEWHGFGEVFATTSAVPTWNPTVTPEGWDRWGARAGEPWKGGFPYVHHGRRVTENLAGDDSRVIMDRVIPFIRENVEKDGRPFFAVVWFHTPHEPVVAGDRYRAMYPDAGELRKNYYGSITAMDEQIGRLRQELRDRGVANDTVVFFCSDNGPADALAKKGVASAGPFKGCKHRMYDGGLLVPACVEWPGKIEPGTSTAVRCATVDYFPTIAGLVGFEFSAREKRPMDGVDLMPIISGEQLERGKALFFGYRRLFQGIDGQAIIEGDFKYLREARDGGRERLYDLAKDPGETRDLAEAMPEKCAEMAARMNALDESCQRSRDGADYRY